MRWNQLRGSRFPLSRKYSQPESQPTRLQRPRRCQALRVYLPHSVRPRHRGLSRGPNLDRHRHTTTDYTATREQRKSPRRDPQLLLIPSQSRETLAKLPNLPNSMAATLIRTRICPLMLSLVSYHLANFRFLRRPFPRVTWDPCLLMSSTGPRFTAMRSTECIEVDTILRL